MRSIAFCRSYPTEQVFRVLLIHHPLRSEKGSRHKRLTDSDELLALLKRHGVELILHGHDHIHSTMWFDGPRGRIPAIGVPSASAIAHGHYPAAAYNLFSIEREGETWRCEQTVRGFGDGDADSRIAAGAVDLKPVIPDALDRAHPDHPSQECFDAVMDSPRRAPGMTANHIFRSVANSARPNSASAPRMNPSAKVQKPLRRGFSATTGSGIGVATSACSRSTMRRAT